MVKSFESAPLIFRFTHNRILIISNKNKVIIIRTSLISYSFPICQVHSMTPTSLSTHLCSLCTLSHHSTLKHLENQTNIQGTHPHLSQTRNYEMSYGVYRIYKILNSLSAPSRTITDYLCSVTHLCSLCTLPLCI